MSQKRYTRITADLVSKYRKAREGVTPGGTGGRWEKVTEVGLSMYLVEGGSVMDGIQCDANPYWLVCRRCKCFAHTGICKHVLAVTHLKMANAALADRKLMCNLKYMLRTCGKRHKAKDGRMRKVTPALVPTQPRARQSPEQRDDAEAGDSSDEEEEELRRIEGGHWE